MNRPDFQEWGLIVASAVSTRGDCIRRRVGAVILDRNNRICGAGYNGTYTGAQGCLQGACPRGRHGIANRATSFDPNRCVCGAYWPCPEAAEPGSSYDTGPGACIAVHAEVNALLDVSEKGRLADATMYITSEPCKGCLKILRNTSIRRLVWEGEGWKVKTAAWPFE